MLKKKFLHLARSLGFMHTVDRLNFAIHKSRYRKRNHQFRKENPGFILPPDYMLYESYRLDYRAYHDDGIQTATWIRDSLLQHLPAAGGRLLEWGCGPARIVRHLPALFPRFQIHGTDYNPDTIRWCKANIQGVQFNLNTLEPPLPYANGFFDAVYALSVLTHLSEGHHHAWLKELHRILKPGGVLLITTQGNVFREKLHAIEVQDFDAGRLVTRSNVREGHRSFSAFQPIPFMHKIFSDQWEILTFIPGTLQSWGPEQDTWVVRRKMSDDR